jgi:hypothetical protein
MNIELNEECKITNNAFLKYAYAIGELLHALLFHVRLLIFLLFAVSLCRYGTFMPNITMMMMITRACTRKCIPFASVLTLLRSVIQIYFARVDRRVPTPTGVIAHVTGL